MFGRVLHWRRIIALRQFPDFRRQYPLPWIPSLCEAAPKVKFFCPRRNLNSVEDYSSSSVGVVCRLSSVVSPILKMGFFPNALS